MEEINYEDGNISPTGIGADPSFPEDERDLIDSERPFVDYI